MAERRIRIHDSPLRPMLVMGGERAPIMLLGLVCIGLFLAFIRDFSLPIAFAAVCIWSGGLYLLRGMAKSDPQMLDVVKRHMKYKAHYDPRSTPWAE